MPGMDTIVNSLASKLTGTMHWTTLCSFSPFSSVKPYAGTCIYLEKEIH